MNVIALHEWHVTTAQANEIQLRLASQISRAGNIVNPRFIAGADISVNKFAKTGTGAVVVLSYPELEMVEVQVVTDRIEFPYVPGLLTFREAPLVLAAFEKLTLRPDALIVDGQGIAHPRRIGLASHLGLLLGLPTIGCAKSRLLGEYREPDSAAGSFSDLLDDDEIIGAALRTRAGIKPVFVSIGHRIDLPSAIRWTLACCRGYRIPEPLRLAHQAAGGYLGEKSRYKIQ
ncbi:MAG: endonuclease V [Chloroflexi bacterium RBG_16_56_11]|nr:MAG: endonuclease V [Chloroflexi bacterium RBG_16_56_11]